MLARTQLENDTSNNGQAIQREEEDSYRQTMILEKGRVFDDLNKHRYDRDLAQIQEFRDYKAKELQALQDERDKTHQQYMAMAEL
jgi:hypothetical protein